MDYDLNPKYLKIVYGIIKLEYYMDIQKIRKVSPPYPQDNNNEKKNIKIY